MKLKDCTLCDNKIDAQIDPKTGKAYWLKGHNAQPLSEGRCCTTCNTTKVIPARMSRIKSYQR